MKKVLVLLCVLAPCLGFSQYKYYKDSSYNQAFNLLSTSTSVNNNNFWDDPEYAIPLGFTFHLFSDTTDTIHISQEVGVGAFITMDSVTPLTSTFSGIIAFGSDLQDRDLTGTGSASPISYTLSGSSPSRIFKLEWKNAGFFNPIDNGNSTADFIDLQLWLYEGSDVVEIRFGNGNYVSTKNDLYDGGPGALIGLFDSTDHNFNSRMIYFMTDTVTNATLDSITSFSSMAFPPGMTGNPVAGSVYHFIPGKAGTSVGYTSYNTIVSHDINYFSERNEVRIDIYNNDKFEYAISDMQGNIVSKGSAVQGRNTVNTNTLAKGMYVVKLSSSNENVSFKFAK